MALTIDRYRAMLPVSKHRLDDELEIQSQTMDDVSREVVARHSRLLRAKDELARVEGRLAAEIKEDDPKLSIPGIESKVRRHRERLAAFDDWMAARADHEEWVGLLEAWRNKGYSIKTLAELYSAQYFALRSSTSKPDADYRRPRREDPPPASTRTRRGLIDE